MSINQIYFTHNQPFLNSNQRVTVSQHIIQTPNFIRFIYPIPQPPSPIFQIRPRAVTAVQFPQKEVLQARQHRMSVVSKQLKRKNENQGSVLKKSKGEKIQGKVTGKCLTKVISKGEVPIEQNPYSLRNHISTQHVLEPTCDFFACNEKGKDYDYKKINVESVGQPNFKRQKIFKNHKKSVHSDEINQTGQILQRSSQSSVAQFKSNSPNINTAFLNDIVLKIIKSSEKTMEELDVPPCVANSWQNSKGDSKQKMCGGVSPFLLLSQE